MMRFLLMGTILTFAAFSLPQSAVADDFGSRFYGKAPKALGPAPSGEADTVDIAQDEELVKELQEIVPAAGEESDDTPSLPLQPPEE